MNQALSYDTHNITGFGVKLLWFFFTLFIFYGALIPFELVFDSNLIIRNIDKISWVPFVDPDGSRASIPDVVQNLLFFIPFGFFGVLSFSRYKFFAMFFVTFFGFVVSLNVEILQLTTFDRTSSITDIICNTVGAGIGAIAAFMMYGFFRGLLHFSFFQKIFINPYYYLFVFSIFVIAASTLQPFDFSLDVGIVWSQVKGFLQNPIVFTSELTDELVVGFRYFLFGLVTTWWLRSSGNLIWPIAGIVLSIAIGAFFEFSQFIVKSRLPSAQDLLVITIACTAGSLFAVIAPKKIAPIVWMFPAIVISGVAAAVQTLSPFEFSAIYREMNMSPFLPYYEDTSFNAVANFIESLLIYFPLGFILQFSWSRQRSAFLLIVVIVGSMAYAIEYMQGWVVGRYPDITDVIGGLLGAVIAGALCLRWSRVFYREEEGSEMTKLVEQTT